MRKIGVRLCVAFLLLSVLPPGCTSAPSSSAKGSGGSGGSSAQTGGGGGTSLTGGGSGGSSSTGSGGSTDTGGGSGTLDVTGGSSGTGGDATGGPTETGGASGAGGDAIGGMSTGGGGGTLTPDGGTDAPSDDQGDGQDGPEGDVAGGSGDDTLPADDGGEGETGASCTDKAQNGAETDVDCGGGICSKCGSGMMCTSDDDCRSGSCASGRCADAFAATAPVTQSGNLWRLTLGTVVFEVDSAVAGKIVTFSIDGTDVLVDNMGSTGSVFWTSPQSDWVWPPPPAMDTLAYTPSTRDNVLIMTGPVWGGGLSVTKRHWGNVEHQAVTIEYALKNGTSAAITKAPWEITRVYPGGLTFFPNGDQAARLGDPSFLVVPFTSSQGALWFKYKTSEFYQDVKGGADGLEGWAAHIACGIGLEKTCATSPIFIKQWTDTNTPAPGEREVEIYANAGHNYVEFEQQGAYQSIPAGGTMVWTMHWLLRKLPGTVAPTAGSAALLTWVRGQLL